MRILIITYSYAPAISPRAFRWSAIAEYWAQQGHHIDAVCAWKHGTLPSEILNGVHVYRTGGKTTEFLRNRFGIEKPCEKEALCNQEGTAGINLRHKAGRLVKWLHDHTWKKVYWPDYACLWYFSAVRKTGQLLEESHYDSLITVSHPFTGHLIGLNLKKKYPQIKWVVDVGDPFCFIEKTLTNNHRLYQRLNYKCEGEIFEKASAIAVTTQATLKRYVDIFPECKTKIHVIPPLLSLPQKHIKESSSNRNGKTRLVFVGTLYKNIRNPKFLLKIFGRLLETRLDEKLELHFWGGIHDCHDLFIPYNNLIENKIFLHGTVSHEKILQDMEDANVLINIGNDTSCQLPSKVVEYVSTGKPILNIVKMKEDSSMEFCSKYPASMTIFEDNQPASEDIVKIMEFIENPPAINKLWLEKWISSFRIDSISNSYEALL